MFGKVEHLNNVKCRHCGERQVVRFGWTYECWSCEEAWIDFEPTIENTKSEREWW